MCQRYPEIVLPDNVREMLALSGLDLWAPYGTNGPDIPEHIRLIRPNQHTGVLSVSVPAPRDYEAFVTAAWILLNRK